MRIVITVFVCLLFWPAFGRVDNDVSGKKVGTAKRLQSSIQIDGQLNELAWKESAVLSGFITSDPEPGKPANQKTEVRLLYTEEALYVSAFLHEEGKDNILRELSQRDNFANCDFFGVFIDAYKDGINGVGFIVTSAGVQIDSKISAFGEDFSWNAVWNSAVTVTDSGWVAELEIPYGALRFPDKNVQEWHINFSRRIRRIRETSYWNQVKPDVNGFFNQAGLLQGIADIKTPIRLQLYPYVSGYYNTFNGEENYSFNGGMDVKYGLSDAFTLDMTLIPDFGQVQSDNQILNVTPFEVRFNERRQFFTEGTELFNKGGLFYSRRIGGTPLKYGEAFAQVQEGEELIENPANGKLVNATKVSGRTEKGLGIGVFNAVSAPTFARIKQANGEIREFQTDPLTNFSVVVLDQNLGNNSYVTLINTNVMRAGSAYDANVIGTQFELRNKENFLSVSGGGAFNQKFGVEEEPQGFQHNVALEKISGNVNYGVSYYIESDTYDPNDLGFLLNNNSFSKSVYGSYQQFKPIGWFNRFGINASLNQSTLYNPQSFVSFNGNLNAFFITRGFDAFGGGITHRPYGFRDYFEPRTPGYVFKVPSSTNYNLWISSDYRKTFALDVNFGQEIFSERQGPYTNISISPRVRVNNQLSFVYEVSNQNRVGEYGFALFNSFGRNAEIPGLKEDAVYFAKRRRNIHEQILNANYIFTSTMGITARFRHYWSEVAYQEFFELQPNGDLKETDYNGRSADGQSYHNTSFNAFNVDIVFRWVFLPGSEISVVWKDAILTNRDRLSESYEENIQHTFRSPRSDSFSIKVLYFVDYYSSTRALRTKRDLKNKNF
ncbi:MAG: DUF5916 domain-containing protein [Luteibaculum sp.]